MNALQIENLSKRFDGFMLDHINLVLPSGCIMGLIGENGAGKSTLMKLIANILHKHSGTITILGRDNEEDLHITMEDVGVVLDEMGIPHYFTAEEIDEILGHSFRNWDSGEFERLMDVLELPRDKCFKEFSQGMKMKMRLAIALAHKPKLLLLDEATNGLDPIVRDTIVQLLLDFTREEDHSVLISSHIVSDLEKLCDYVAFLHKGKLVLCQEKDELLSRYGLFRGTREQLQAYSPEAVCYVKESPYGVEAMVLRDSALFGETLGPVNLEEIFLSIVKGELK